MQKYGRNVTTQNVILETFIAYWRKHDATIPFTTYRCTKHLLNETIDTRVCALEFFIQPHHSLSVYPSLFTHFSTRDSPNLKLYRSLFVWSWCWRLHHTLCLQEIRSVFSVESEAALNNIFLLQYALFKSSDDKFHKNAHCRGSWSCFDQKTAKVNWVAITDSIHCSRVPVCT